MESLERFSQNCVKRVANIELVVTAFLAISLAASIFPSRTKALYTIILLVFGIAMAG